MAQRYRLKLNKLQFCSVVDEPAQPNAKTLLIKRAPSGDEISAEARLAKVSDELGLAFFWAFTATNEDGSPHFDLQGDAIDGDFVKAAMDFMTTGGGAVDEMHNGVPGAGRVVFAMPMTPDIAKAFGVVSKYTGLMIAIKPEPDVLAKLKDGTYTGVSIGGVGTRELVKSVAKRSLYTTEVLGHQHTLSIECGEPGIAWYTSYQTSEGADCSHTHGVVRGEDGALVILADGGHTHELAPGQPDVVVVNSDAVVVVQARSPAADARKSTPATAASKADLTSKEPSAMTTEANKTSDLEKQVAELTKRCDRIRALGPTEHALWKSLPVEEGEAFLAKSVADRAAEMAEFAKSNALEYTADDGTVYLKSQSAMAKLHKMADDERKLRLEGEVAKRAADIFGNIAGADEARVNLLKRIESEPDGTKREAMLGVIKSAAAAMGKLGVAKGFGSETPTDGDPLVRWNSSVAEFAKRSGIADLGKAEDKFLGTPEGLAAKRAYDEGSASLRRAQV